MGRTRDKYNNNRRRDLKLNKKKERKQRLIEETFRPQHDVVGAPYACSPPVSLNLLDNVEQARKELLTPKDWHDLRKNVVQPNGHKCPTAQGGTSNATPVHMSSSEVVVAPATLHTTRAARLLHLAQTQLGAESPKQPQPQPAAIIPHTLQGGMQTAVKVTQTEMDLLSVRNNPAPLLTETAQLFTVPYLMQAKFTDVIALRKGGYGMVYTAKWHNESVVVKLFRGEDAEKNACRELGQVQLARASWSVVPVVGYTWWVSRTLRTPCLVYRYAGDTLWSALSDPTSHPLASPLGLCEELCRAVHSLHTDAGMIHLDLKGDNVILRLGRERGVYKVRLIDCGTSQPVIKNTNPYLRLGRDKSKEKHWFGPEYRNATSFKPSTDTWSLAFLLADCLLPQEDGQYHKVAPRRGDIARQFGTEVEEKVLLCFHEQPRWRPSLPCMIALFKAKK